MPIRLKNLIVGATFFTFLVGSIFMFCSAAHRNGMIHSFGDFSASSSIVTKEPCCQTQSNGHDLLSATLGDAQNIPSSKTATIALVSTLLLVYLGYLIGDKGGGTKFYAQHHPDSRLYSYLSLVFAQGLLHSKIFNPAVASI